MNRIGLEVSLNVSDLISNSARGASALKELDRAMDSAQKKGDIDLYGKMAYEKDRLQAGMFGFNQDIKNLENNPKIKDYNDAIIAGKDISKFTADQEFMSILKNISDRSKALESALNGVRDAAEKGDFEGVQQSGLEARQAIGGISEESTTAEMSGQKARNELLTISNMEQMMGAAAGVLKTYVSQLDRSSIIERQGGGDVAGAEIDELRRSAEMKDAAGSGLGTALGIGGGVLLSLIFPGLALPLIAGGASMGSSVFGKLGIGDEAKANKLATQEAYAAQWRNQAPSAMELTGMLGRYGGTEEENTRAIRETFSTAAGAANAYGFSAAEGIEAIKQGAAQGLSEGDAVAAAKQAFAFERGTGADRATMLDLETRARRFGMDNMLGTAWQGLQASGMNTGQFNEFLRAMQRTFEDGISKGFVRGADEIAGNLAYLADLGGGSELYKGEQGAQVMQSLSAGIESATSLSSVNDVLTYRAAQNVVERWKNSEKGSDDHEKYLKLHDLDESQDGYEAGDPYTGSSWYESSLLINKGFTTDLFNELMKIFQFYGMKSEDDNIQRIKSRFNITETQAGFLYHSWLENREKIKDTDYQAALALKSSEPPASESNELNYQKQIEEFKTEIMTFGQEKFDISLSELSNRITMQLGLIRSDFFYDPSAPPAMPADTTGMTASETLAIREKELAEAIERGNELGVTNTQIALTKERQRLIYEESPLGQFFDKKDPTDKKDLEIISTTLNEWETDEQYVRLARVSAGLADLPAETRERWNMNNTLNYYKGSDVDGLILAMENLIAVERSKLKEEATVTIYLEG